MSLLTKNDWLKKNGIHLLEDDIIMIRKENIKSNVDMKKVNNYEEDDDVKDDKDNDGDFGNDYYGEDLVIMI